MVQTLLKRIATQNNDMNSKMYTKLVIIVTYYKIKSSFHSYFHDICFLTNSGHYSSSVKYDARALSQLNMDYCKVNFQLCVYYIPMMEVLLALTADPWVGFGKN